MSKVYMMGQKIISTSGKAYHLDVLLELLASGIINEEQVKQMFWWPNSEYNIDDRVSIKPGVIGEGHTGTVIARDRQRTQWHVRLDNGAEYWYNLDEIMPATPRTAAPPVDTWLDKCKHELKLYTGLTEQFNYCHKCGLKEDEL